MRKNKARALEEPAVEVRAVKETTYDSWGQWHKTQFNGLEHRSPQQAKTKSGTRRQHQSASDSKEYQWIVDFHQLTRINTAMSTLTH